MNFLDPSIILVHLHENPLFSRTFPTNPLQCTFLSFSPETFLSKTKPFLFQTFFTLHASPPLCRSLPLQPLLHCSFPLAFYANAFSHDCVSIVAPILIIVHLVAMPSAMVASPSRHLLWAWKSTRSSLQWRFDFPLPIFFPISSL